MGTLASKLLKRASLTECAFTNSFGGAVKHFFWRYILNVGRTFPTRYRSVNNKDAEQAASILIEKGLVLGPARSFLSDAGMRALEEATIFIRHKCESKEVQEILDEGINREIGKDYLVDIVSFTDEQKPDGALLRLALDPKLLHIVAHYLGVSPYLHAIGSWLNFPSEGEARKSQLWHRDPEDLKTVKVFIYLDEVTHETGPFSYIFNTQPFGSACDRIPAHKHPRRVTDEEMQSQFPKETWFECIGPPNTMVIADTVGFHRGGNVEKGNRLLITFTYTSASPQVERWLRVTGTPSWVSDPLQQKAL